MKQKNLFGLVFGITVLLTGSYAFAGGDIAAGKTKYAVCASCHGTNGISAQPDFPNLAGQYQDYIVRALIDYKTGERENPIMKGFVANLSKQDMADLAAYYSAGARRGSE